MSNGSMFAHLEKFKSKDFWSEHRMITFNTLTDKQVICGMETFLFDEENGKWFVEGKKRAVL